MFVVVWPMDGMMNSHFFVFDERGFSVLWLSDIHARLSVRRGSWRGEEGDRYAFRLTSTRHGLSGNHHRSRLSLSKLIHTESRIHSSALVLPFLSFLVFILFTSSSCDRIIIIVIHASIHPKIRKAMAGKARGTRALIWLAP